VSTLLVVGMLGWRGFCLWGLPDIGEPFDLKRYGTAEVRDADNAMVVYRQAARKLIPPGSDYKLPTSKAWEVNDWSTADPELRRWVVDNRPAVALWLEGTERPDSLLVQPREVNGEPSHMSLIFLQHFTRLATLEASALEEAGDLEGAWRLHRAALRSSRHAGMHGGTINRYLGLNLLNIGRAGVGRWVEDPRVTPAMLHRAIADIDGCRRMTPPMSEMIRDDYFAVRSILDDSLQLRGFHRNGSEGEWAWYNRFAVVPDTRRFLMREPERSVRVLNLMTAGQLAQCDRPQSARPKLASRRYTIYELDDRTPPSVAAIDPEDLARWADRSEMALVWGGRNNAAARIESDPGILDSILIRMAERAHEIEQGRPPRTYADLLGPYLKTLPEGFEPTDQVSASPDPR
jgi:hypothetical protein